MKTASNGISLSGLSGVNGEALNVQKSLLKRMNIVTIILLALLVVCLFIGGTIIISKIKDNKDNKVELSGFFYKPL